MPYAYIHYPFENVELFEKNFPGHFVAEGLDQTRGWSVSLFSHVWFIKGLSATLVMNYFCFEMLLSISSLFCEVFKILAAPSFLSVLFWVQIKTREGVEPPHNTMCHVGDHYASRYMITVAFLFPHDVISNLVALSFILLGHVGIVS